jgi:hypothetical protein
LSQWAKHADEFDVIVRNTTESILKQPLPPDAYDQASVSTRFGGLGIRRIVDHGPVAFIASHNGARLQCKENWLPIDGVPDSGVAPNQRAASALVDRVTLDRLIEKGSIRDKQRLRRLDCEHANSWITALPSATDGKDTILPPKIFITAVSRLLGLPVYSKPFPCPLCQQTMDILGDHALCCKKTQDLITRHNRLRNWLFWALLMRASDVLETCLSLCGDTVKGSPLMSLSFAQWRLLTCTTRTHARLTL